MHAMAGAAIGEVTRHLGGATATYIDECRMGLWLVWRVDWRTYREAIPYECFHTREQVAYAVINRTLPWAREAEAIRKRRTLDFGGAR